MRLGYRLWFGLFPVLLALAVTGSVLVARSNHESHPIVLAVLYPVIALSFVVSGLIAWTIHAGNGTGRLLALVGFLWMVGALWESDTPVVFGLATIFGSLFLAAFLHLMLTFPEG